jgi:hypothetical protein
MADSNCVATIRFEKISMAHPVGGTFRAIMIAFLAPFLRLIFLALGSKRDVLSKNALLKKESEILLWRPGKRRVQFGF